MKVVGTAAAGAFLFDAGIVKSFAQAPVVSAKKVTSQDDGQGSRAKVYFTKYIDAAHLIALYDKINEGIYGKVAVKLHTGEKKWPQYPAAGYGQSLYGPCPEQYDCRNQYAL